WTSIAAFPVSVGLTEAPNGFVIGTKGYVCTGWQNNMTATNVLPTGYAYDTISKAWTAFTNMSANHVERAFSAVFAIGNYGYICSGRDSTGTDVKDLLQYGAEVVSCNTWNEMASFPGVARDNAVNF